MSKELHEILNQEVANFTVLYEKLHHYHWYVKGGQFFTLHEKFEEDYDEITAYVDELAERLIQIGGKPVSSLKQYLEATTILENQHTAKCDSEMVSLLIRDYEQLVSELKHGIELADDADDPVTEDLFIGIVASFEKKLWMYNALINK